ncbi:MAG: type III secretion system cytoplasmic ring protein SctQ [Pseudomonadota bacterium]
MRSCGEDRLQWTRWSGGDWSPAVRLRLMAGPARLSLQLESLTAFAPFFSGPFDDWPQEEWCMLVEISTAPLLNALALVLGTPLRVAQVEILAPSKLDRATPAETDLDFRYFSASTGQHLSGRLSCNQFTALAMLPASSNIKAWDDLHLPMMICAGQLTLNRDEFNSLRVGDVLRSELALNAAPMTFTVHYAGRRLATATASANQLQLHHMESALMTFNSDTQSQIGTNSDGTTATIGSMDDISIALRFDLGQHHLPLRELASLQPGYVIPLGFHPEQQAITICANGAPVGQGELVVVDEELAVRIVRWTAGANA